MKIKGISALILSTLFIALKMTLIKTDFKIDSLHQAGNHY